MSRRLLWLIPLFLLAILAAVILALPAFVASGAHRATIEALASSLTGREVTIRGNLSLAFTPSPRLIAQDVTIAGPARETITARSLTLDIAMPALLQGRLAARTLTLDAPSIAFPWPLPGGPKAVAPPPWLAALHANIKGGTISLGRIVFTGVNADIYTGGGGTVAITGTGRFVNVPLTVSVSLEAPDTAARAALSVSAAGDDPQKFDAHFEGTLDPAGVAAGTLSGSASPAGMAPTTFTGNVRADGTALSATAIQVAQGAAQLTGSAALALTPPALTLKLNGTGLDLAVLRSVRAAAAAVAGHLTLTATDSTLDGFAVPALAAEIGFGPAGIALRQIAATLPGDSVFNLTGTVDSGGALAGQFSLGTADLPALVPAAGLPAAWANARIAARFGGDPARLVLAGLSGQAGPDDFSGDLILNRNAGVTAAAGALHFDQIDLAPAANLLRAAAAAQISGFSADGEVTADRATLGHLQLNHLLLDAAWDGQLNVRRLAFGLYGGMAEGGFRLAPDGDVTTASAVLSVPSAAPLAALLPAAWTPPAAISDAPLSAAMRAEGPVTALATSAVATLGPISVTAAPVLNIPQQTAAGPVTLRHPNAIAALGALALPSGLAWPGAGSIALRATMLYSPARIGLPDFVLSLGDLTADGRVLVTPDRQITAQIDADTLALPPPPANIVMPWARLADARGSIALSANQVWLAGREILGPTAVTATLTGDHVSLNIARAALAGGTLSGSLDAATAKSGTQAPVITANLKLAGADASQITLPVGFPFAIATGTLSGQANLTASGYAQATWAATLAGAASLTATDGTLYGFSLTGLAQALKRPDRFDALRIAALGGATNFASLTVAGAFTHGNFNLTSASLSGADGTANAGGSIDIPDNDLALQTTLLPNVTPPLTLNVTTLGAWSAPKQIPILRPGLAWSPTP